MQNKRLFTLLPGNVLAVLQVITARERARLLGVLCLHTCAVIIELVILGLFVPLIAMVSDPAISGRSRTLSALSQLTGAASARTFIVIFAAGLLLLLAVRGLLIVAVSAFQRRVCSDLAEDLGRKVLLSLLRMSYLEHARTNSSVLLRIAASEIDIVVNTNLMTAIFLIAELIVTAVILLTLAVIQPLIIGPLALVIGATAYAIYGLKRVRLLEAGKAMRAAHADMLKQVQQSLGDVRFARLTGAEASFADAVGKGWQRYTNAQMTTLNIQRGTRIVIESGALGTIILLIVYFVLTSPAPSAALPTLALLAVGAMRLVPGIARIVTFSQILRQLQTSVDVVVERLRIPPRAADAAPDVEPLPLERTVDIDGVQFSYPDAPRPALDGVSLSFSSGEIIGIVGPSGAGKSTLIDVLCGLIPPDSGGIRVDGVDIEVNLARWQRSIGYVPQSTYILDDTILANVAFAVPEARIDRATVQHAIAGASLAEFVSSLPAGLQTIVGERGTALSGGQRQRLAIARALYRNPSILIFDEATSSLDAITEKAITDALRDLHGRKTVVIIAHRLNTVKACDRLYVLHEGRVVGQGSFAELYRSNRYFREIAEISNLDVERQPARTGAEA